ncbi:Centromere protein O [Quillaja saponaria]|uniref:Centromere protein O n=1 Tax=Quillaja saponaria TaxID=32244 RepID=A0AAD7LXF9_QUISA|nr:Centromere protein O [Quillaja saponaria]
MEADRKAMAGDTNQLAGPHSEENISYKVGNKVICCLEGARIGIQYETSFAGEPCELYHCVLQSKSFLERVTLLEHTAPFFLPILEAENDFLSSNAMKFIDPVGDLLQAYVDRREQVRLIKELYGNQIGKLYHSLPYHLIEFLLDDFDCVLAWPTNQSKKYNGSTMNRKEYGVLGSHLTPARLTYAEDALRTMSLPEAYAEIVLNLPRALQQILQQRALP